MPGAAALDTSAFVPGGRALLAERIAEALRGTGEVWLLTGERGSGRTALLDDAIARMPGPRARMVWVDADPDGGKLDLPGFVAQVAGERVTGRTGPGEGSRGEGVAEGDALERAFERLAGDEPTVLVVDGADGLAAEVLRYIQFAARSAPGLQVLLVALPGFRAVLDRDEFAHLRARLGPELVIPRLSDEDAVRFVRHRLGAVRTPPVRSLEGPALDALIRAGQGLPGRLTGLLDRVSADGAGRGEGPLTPAAVRRAVHELDHPDHPDAPPPPDVPPAAPAPITPAPIRAPAPAAPAPRPGGGPDSRAKLAPPRPFPRRSVLVPVAAALVVAGLGAWAAVATVRGAWAPVPSAAGQASPAAVSASPSAGSAQDATRPALPPPRASPPPDAAPTPAPAPAPTPAQDAARPRPSPQGAVPPELLVALLSRGEAMLAVGDVSAARLLFERAASGGDAAASRAAGRAYDPAVLARLGAVGIRPDAARAAEYYARAAALGDAEARRLLRQLEAAGAGR